MEELQQQVLEQAVELVRMAELEVEVARLELEQMAKTRRARMVRRDAEAGPRTVVAAARPLTVTAPALRWTAEVVVSE